MASNQPMSRPGERLQHHFFVLLQTAFVLKSQIRTELLQFH